MITGWISLYISCQIQSVSIKQKDILEHSHWISEVMLTSASVISVIIFSIIAHIIGKINSDLPFIYYGAMISLSTILAMIFAAYRLPRKHR
jgi:hypothetical protein